jgi:hypothetical protein
MEESKIRHRGWITVEPENMAPRQRLLKLGVALRILNFVVLWGKAVYLGGVPDHSTSDGHYFLDNRGRFTEVSRQTLVYMKWHERSVFLTHPLGLVCLLLLARRRKE